VEVLKHPQTIAGWKQQLWQQHGSVWLMLALSLILFPKLALGLSGFETGVAVMPLIRGDRIRNTKKLLLTAALKQALKLVDAFIAKDRLASQLLPAIAELQGCGRNLPPWYDA
jgi:hypothetical protein